MKYFAHYKYLVRRVNYVDMTNLYYSPFFEVSNKDKDNMLKELQRYRKSNYFPGYPGTPLVVGTVILATITVAIPFESQEWINEFYITIGVLLFAMWFAMARAYWVNNSFAAMILSVRSLPKFLFTIIFGAVIALLF